MYHLNLDLTLVVIGAKLECKIQELVGCVGGLKGGYSLQRGWVWVIRREFVVGIPGGKPPY